MALNITDPQVDRLQNLGIIEGTKNYRGAKVNLSPGGDFSIDPNTKITTPDVGRPVQTSTVTPSLPGVPGSPPSAPETMGDILGGVELSTPLSGTEIEPFDEDAARREAQRNQMRMFQAEIDATNEVYDQLLNEARLQGQGRLGSQRAIAARGGILGSDFAGAQKSRVQAANTQQERAIQAERAARIGAILGNVRGAAAQELEARRAAYQQGADAIIANLAGQQQRREQNAQRFARDFIAQGIDPTEMDEAEIAEILDGTGITRADLIRNYVGQLPAPEERGGFTLSEGEQRFDSQGNLIASGPAAPEKGTIYSTKDGLVRVTPNGESELVFPVSKSESGGGGLKMEVVKSGGLAVPGSEIAAIERDLAQNRNGEFTQTGAYTNAIDQWTNAGGLEQDFFKAFPPSDWLDPADENVPGYVRNQMKNSNSLLSFGGQTFSFEEDGADAEVSDSGAITDDGGSWWRFWE